MSHDARLAQLKIVLPEALAPVANYVPYQISGNQLFISGQISNGPGGLIKGKLGADMGTAFGSGGPSDHVHAAVSNTRTERTTAIDASKPPST